MKPIEPGCLALVISGPNTGETCEVICWANCGDVFPTPAGNYCNNSGLAGWAVDFGDGCGVYETRALLRLDDNHSLAQRRSLEVTA